MINAHGTWTIAVIHLTMRLWHDECGSELLFATFKWKKLSFQAQTHVETKPIYTTRSE